MKNSLLVFGILFSLISRSFELSTDMDYRHIRFDYLKDTVDILVTSKKGEKDIPKSILFFCQGSLPVPLVIHDEEIQYGIFPFDAEIFSSKYHVVIVGKPGITFSEDVSMLNPDFTVAMPSYEFVKNDNLDYYVERNNTILKYLTKQEWVLTNQLVVAGHSAGATVAAKMSLENKLITHLIFASGNPFGRIMTMIERSRAYESDSTKYAQNDYEYWTLISTKNPDELSHQEKNDLSFSIPPFEYLKELKIPVCVSYGTKDHSAPFNDYLKAWCIHNKKSNFKFFDYVGLEHNFFGSNAQGETDYNQFNWDKVAGDWSVWLNESTITE